MPIFSPVLRKRDAVEMGASAVSTGLAMGLLQEYAEAANVTNDELAADAADLGLPVEAVEHGAPHEGRIVSFASALERVLPTKGKVLAPLFLRQAITYINDKALAARIDNKVASLIFGAKLDPVIVPGHRRCSFTWNGGQLPHTPTAPRRCRSAAR
jgi:hypothetical protein